MSVTTPTDVAGRRDTAHEAVLRRDIAALLPELRAYARFLARDRAAADDAVQEAVVRALGALHQFTPDTSLRAWMFTILRNGFYEQRRRQARETAMIGAALDEGEALAPVPPAQDGRQAVQDVQALIWALPPLLREALMLVGVKELTHEEAARVCNVPVGTMKARLSRARAALSAAVRGQDGAQ